MSTQHLSRSGLLANLLEKAEDNAEHILRYARQNLIKWIADGNAANQLKTALKNSRVRKEESNSETIFMKTPRSGYVYKYRKAREAAEKHRERFGKPDGMEPDKRDQYEELLREAALYIVRLKMHLGEVGLNVIEREESLADIKDLMTGPNRLDELLDEYHDSTATSTLQSEEFKSFFGSESVDNEVLKQLVVKLMREAFYSTVLEDELLESRDDFDIDTIWGIFDEANISTTESFIERKTKLVPILARNSPSPTLKSYVKLVSSLFLLGQWTAAIVFCRSVLDDILDKVHQNEDELGRLQKESLPDYFERVFHAKCGYPIDNSSVEKEIEDVKNIIRRANNLLHASENVSHPTEKECLEGIRLVFQVSEKLIDQI